MVQTLEIIPASASFLIHELQITLLPHPQTHTSPLHPLLLCFMFASSLKYCLIFSKSASYFISSLHLLIDLVVFTSDSYMVLVVLTLV